MTIFNLRNTCAMALTTLLLSVGLSSTAQAGFEHCFTIDGELHCYPIPVEQVRIRIKPLPDPDPPPFVDISDILTQLQEVLGGESTTWYMGDVAGNRSFLLDLDQGRAIGIGEPQSGPGF